jgi:hypothetical protein
MLISRPEMLTIGNAGVSPCFEIAYGLESRIADIGVLTIKHMGWRCCQSGRPRKIRVGAALSRK